MFLKVNAGRYNITITLRTELWKNNLALCIINAFLMTSQPIRRTGGLQGSSWIGDFKRSSNNNLAIFNESAKKGKLLRQ